MARMSQITTLLAQAAGVDYSTVDAYYRRLRADGLIVQRGRGRSAPDATTESVALLLIAYMASPKMIDAAQTVALFDAETRRSIAEALERPAEGLAFQVGVGAVWIGYGGRIEHHGAQAPSLGLIERRTLRASVLADLREALRTPWKNQTDLA